MPRLSKIGAAALAAFGWTSGGVVDVTASYLQVAGGGGGGFIAGGNRGAGGGAGGLLTGTVSLNPTLSYTIVVGAGGTPLANGSNSTITGTGISITASVGGGAGGSQNGASSVVGQNGGSGGGGPSQSGSGSTAGGTGTAGQGNDGAAGSNVSGQPYGCGGGGGAGAVGTLSNNPAGAGGVGLTSSITGTSTYYAGGGGGGTYAAGPGVGGAGGLGGGGTGGGSGGNSTSGTANLGGGGGGAEYSQTSGSSGGSGVVIISYVGAQQFGGGVVTSSGGSTIHTFNTSGTLSPLSSLTASALIIAGGGAGGGTTNGAGLGGGGAGGMQTPTGLTIDTNSIYLVTVGAGGAAVTTQGTNGSNSLFSAYATASVGGGGGGDNGANGSSGGSGGGGSWNGGTGGAGTAGQGNAGGNAASGGSPYPGGGGGGAGTTGFNGSGSAGGNGGVGAPSSISGTSVYYAGGGGGGTRSGGSAGAGQNGGGNGSSTNDVNGFPGTANTGGGGGGGSQNASPVSGGAGGSGIVIISYPGSTQQMAGGTVTVAGGNVIHTFTSSGYLTPIVLATNSLRFRSSASAYLNRTPASAATSRRIMTYSVWAKIGTLGTQRLFYEGFTSVSDFEGLSFNTSDQLEWTAQVNGGTSYGVRTPAVFRDPSAWYHIVCAVDTTQATSTNRVRIYVNGVEQTGLTTFYSGFPAQNTDLEWNNQSSTQVIGWGGHFGYYDGYMTEINMIDGQQLSPFSFGTTSDLGVWQPIRYGGSYGTNGFYLPFTASSVTANYLVVAGGGSGADYGGGGAGGYRTSAGTSGGGGGAESTLTLNPLQSYTVTVGAGGTGSATGAAGSDSIFSTITSIGGGQGANNTTPTPNGSSGGSGGGGRWDAGTGGAGTANQGYAGGDGNAGSSTPFSAGGGGGAGAVGQTGQATIGGAGGNGVASSITGSSVTRGGGGGGAHFNGAGGNAAGGTGGGGTGGKNTVGLTAGTANTGGGGGGSGNTGTSGANGGSGVVIISYAGSAKFTGGTITSSGGNTIHTFTSSGTLVGNIATDYSPNGNNWTTNNISTTSGSTYDIMTDVPTLTSATTANYCVLNPLDKGGTVNPKNGNLGFANTAGTYSIVRSTVGITSGKWYFEYTIVNSASIGGGSTSAGLVRYDSVLAGKYLGQDTNTLGSVLSGTPSLLLYNGTNKALSSGLNSFSVGAVIQYAYDADAGKLWVGVNNSWDGGNDPSTGSTPTLSSGFAGSSGPWFFAANGLTSPDDVAVNFGQQPFTYTPPSGFLRLNTFNLPTPTIGATASTTANEYFDATTYTGNGGTQSVTNSGSMQPDFLWIKPRSTANVHVLSDSVRGTDANGYLFLASDLTNAESTFNTTWHNSFGKVTALNSNGFTVVDGSSSGNVNTSAVTYVAWQWRASNATAVTNTNGSIISSVSANTTSGFSIVTYTGNGANSTVGHGLGVVPSLYVVKRRNNADGWFVYSNQLAATQYLRLNLTNAAATFNFWQDTAPTSSVFYISTDVSVNASSDTYVAYCFAQVAGYSAFGSYTGNGSTDGPFIFTGFRPRFVMFKSTGIENWIIHDTARDAYNVSGSTLIPNLSDSEYSNNQNMDILSNGVKMRSTNDATNTNGVTYTYMAFAENPFKYANAR